MVTFNLNQMTPQQLARLYLLCLSLYRVDDAEAVYEAGCRNCGPKEFCEEVARAK